MGLIAKLKGLVGGAEEEDQERYECEGCGAEYSTPVNLCEACGGKRVAQVE